MHEYYKQRAKYTHETTGYKSELDVCDDNVHGGHHKCSLITVPKQGPHARARQGDAVTLRRAEPQLSCFCY